MTMKVKKSAADWALDFVIYAVMILTIVVTLYPFINSLAISLNNADDTTRGGITFYPRMFTMRNYELIFKNEKIYTAYIITIIRTVIGTVGGLFFTSILAFGLAHKALVGRKFYTMMCLIPMYFSGGLIPSYFLIRELGLTNNFWVYIFPMLVNLWNMMLMRSFFQGIPEALEESARIDGANDFIVLFRILFPLCLPVFAVLGLYYAVGNWNSWFNPMIFLQNRMLFPLQLVLREILINNDMTNMVTQTISGEQDLYRALVKYCTIIVATLPILAIYPFIQRYFIKGVMIGAIKG